MEHSRGTRSDDRNSWLLALRGCVGFTVLGVGNSVNHVHCLNGCLLGVKSTHIARRRLGYIHQRVIMSNLGVHGVKVFLINRVSPLDPWVVSMVGVVMVVMVINVDRVVFMTPPVCLVLPGTGDWDTS